MNSFGVVLHHTLKGRNEVVHIGVPDGVGQRGHIVGTKFNHAHGVLNFVGRDDLFGTRLEVAQGKRVAEKNGS